ncbi:MAG: hypothetical protein QOG61_2304, partial [Candidatus Binataceae bacterium]|nr:hypothetical protein [Candidatus Binataceae bacterium]
LNLTEVRVTPRKRGSRRSRSNSSDNSRKTISATRPGRLPSPDAMIMDTIAIRGTDEAARARREPDSSTGEPNKRESCGGTRNLGFFLKPTFILTHLAQLTELVSSARKLA